MKALFAVIIVLTSATSILAQGYIAVEGVDTERAYLIRPLQWLIPENSDGVITYETFVSPTPPQGIVDADSLITDAPEPSPWAITLLSTGLIFIVSRFSRRFQIHSKQS